MAKKTRQRKGVWSDERLPVADRYVWPASRRHMILLGAAGCVVALALLVLLFAWRGPRVVSPGPLASAHANFEGDCASCHGGTGSGSQTVASTSCQGCHERVGDAGDLGFYSFAAHYAYRGGLGPDEIETARAEGAEMTCAACHPDHRGREAILTRVSDDRCAACHDFGSFARHPEFEPLREEQADAANLKFGHRLHVHRVMKERRIADPQRACLTCHEPEPTGRGFLPLDYERHCGACHLTEGVATPALATVEPGDEDAVGVWTLEGIRRSGEPGTRWAFFANPDDFFPAGRNAVGKSPVYHEDPWILTNLRRIRRTLHPELGLAELLTTRVTEAGLPAGDVLLTEAVATLRSRARDLRGTADPAVQEDLRRIDQVLETVEARIETGRARVAADLFAAPARVNPELSDERVARLRQLALDLTEPCRTCHVVTNASILRVGTDLKTLRRAEFDHRAHLVQRPDCVDCHHAVPDLWDVVGTEEPADAPRDDAAIHNLPTVDTCQACPTPREASDACVTCHAFHPDSRRFAAMLAYRPSDEAPNP